MRGRILRKRFKISDVIQKKNDQQQNYKKKKVERRNKDWEKMEFGKFTACKLCFNEELKKYEEPLIQLKAKKIIHDASDQGANIILLQELFQTPYFCIQYDEKIFRLAQPYENNRIINEMAEIAKKLNVVLPISFFEKENNAYYNSIAVIDSDGKILGKYRKSHIPDGAGYLEKYYFNPGDTGFKVWER